MEWSDLAEISLRPFSSDTVPLVLEAMKIIRRRYFNALQCDGCLETPRPLPEPCKFESLSSEWETYAASFMEFSAKDIAPSLLSMRSGALDGEVAEAYLDLLRQTLPPKRIQESRALNRGTIQTNGTGDQDLTILPFRDGDDWAFAVEYTDCVHWYDSRHGKGVPKFSTDNAKPTINTWTGPKNSLAEESGIYMLLGVRCILEGLPLLADRAASKAVSLFRKRMLIELLCEKIDPTNEEFQQFCQGVSGEEPSLFVSSQQSSGSFPNDAASSFPSPLTNNQIANSRNRAAPALATPSSSNQSASPSLTALRQDSPNQTRRILPLSESSQSTAPSTRAHIANIAPNDREIILRNLNDAVLVTRVMGPASASDLLVLWNSVKKQNLRSSFMERYNAVLFYDKMAELGTDDAINTALRFAVDGKSIKDMRRIQYQCKFWKDLCDLWPEGWAGSKYVLLLAFADIGLAKLHPNQKVWLLSQFESRLKDESDSLASSLWSARNIVAAIINRCLPTEHLMIDLYHVKTQESLTDDLYRAYTSLDPRTTLPLPPLNPRDRA